MHRYGPVRIVMKERKILVNTRREIGCLNITERTLFIIAVAFGIGICSDSYAAPVSSNMNKFHQDAYYSTVRRSSETQSEEIPKSLPVYILGSRYLFRGLEGTDVYEVQRMLLKLRYRVQVSGYYGYETENAVEQFQMNNNLYKNGMVGITTLQRLRKAADTK